MMDLTNKTLTDILNDCNQATLVFEKYHIDYCNLGRKKLREVLPNKTQMQRLQSELIELLTNMGQSNINYSELDIAQLIDLIRTEYHEYLRHKISELTQLSQRVRTECQRPEIDQVHDQLMAIFDHLAPHMVREEKVLFPYLAYMVHTVEKGKVPRPPSFGKVKMSVSQMLEEHRDSTEKLNQLAAATDNYTCPDEHKPLLCEYYRELHALDRNLRMHMHLENNVLFEKARAVEKRYLDN